MLHNMRAQIEADWWVIYNEKVQEMHLAGELSWDKV
jgi:hypothetical protein